MGGREGEWEEGREGGRQEEREEGTRNSRKCPWFGRHRKSPRSISNSMKTFCYESPPAPQCEVLINTAIK